MERPSHPNYLAIGIWLAGLMLIGVLLSELSGGWLPLPKWAVAVLILGLSTVKAALVLLYYMHLKTDRRVLAFVVGVPFILILLALGVVFSSRLLQI